MVLITTFRPYGMPDLVGYLNDFKSQNQNSEIGYNLVEYYVYHLFNKNFSVLLFIMAALAIPIKIAAIAQMSRFIWLSMAIYITSKFILQDMIQIRAAVSTGVFIYCCKYKFTNDWRRYAIGTVIALLFHWSSLLMIPVWFLNAKKIRPYIYIIAILLSFLLSASGLYLTKILSFVPIAEIQNAYEGYTYLNKIQSEYNLFSIVVLSKVFLCVVMLLYSNLLKSKYSKYIYIIKIYAISFIIYALFGDVTVAAVRMCEFYQIVEILLLPIICYLFKEKLFGKICVIAIGGIYLWFNLFVTNYIPT